MRPIGLQLGLCYSAVLAIMYNSWSLLAFVLFVKYYDVNSMTIGDNVGRHLQRQHTLSFRHGFVVSNIQCRRPIDIQRNNNIADTTTTFRHRIFKVAGDSIEMGPLRGDVHGTVQDALTMDELSTSETTIVNRRLQASRLWEKYKHRFPSLETESEFYERIRSMPIVTIKVNGYAIDVHQGGLGLPWFIDASNRLKLLNCLEEDVMAHNDLKVPVSANQIPFFESGSHWLPLPGIPASYLPNIRLIEHRTDVEGYEYVTVLQDINRNYTWTYEKSTQNRVNMFDKRGPLELYELTPSGIQAIKVEEDTQYTPYRPVDYFNVPEDVTRFFPRKPRDTGIFRLPKFDDVLNIKMRNMHRDHVLLSCASPAPFGYVQRCQNFWKTVSTNNNASGAVVSYRQLGCSDLNVSDMCLGTMTFGGSVDEATSHDLLDYAINDMGINFVDTSELYPLPTSSDTYGKCESIIGRWLKRRGPGERSKVIIATKVSSRSSHLSWLRSGDCNLSKDNILKAVDGSLSRLNTDYIDLLQLHWPDRYVPMNSNGDFQEVFHDTENMIDENSVPLEDQLEAIQTLLTQGKIRHWGLSNETPWGTLRFHKLAKQAGIAAPASVQLNYNLLCRNEVEKGFVELCRPQNTGIAILAYGALAGGILTGKYLEYMDPTTSGRLLRFPSYMSRYRGSLAARAVKDYYNIAMSYKYPNLCALALRWVLTRPFICSTVIGANDFYQLRENIHCSMPSLGITDLLEREINQLHWKWRDPIRICQ